MWSNYTILIKSIKRAQEKLAKKAKPAKKAAPKAAPKKAKVAKKEK